MVIHKIKVITHSDPIKLLFQKPILTERYAKWMLVLSELDLTIEKPKAIKSQSVVDLLKYSKQEEQTEEVLLVDSEEVLVVKYRKREDHLSHLKKVFERCRNYKLKMNPLKCVFGVTKGKFFGFSVNKKGIRIDQDKVKAILALEPPRNLKQIREFIGKISYLRRFIPALASVIRPLHQLTMKGADYQ